MKTLKSFGKTASAAGLRLSLGDLVSGTAAALANAFADADAVEVVEGNLLDLDCDGMSARRTVLVTWAAASTRPSTTSSTGEMAEQIK